MQKPLLLFGLFFTLLLLGAKTDPVCATGKEGRGPLHVKMPSVKREARCTYSNTGWGTTATAVCAFLVPCVVVGSTSVSGGSSGSGTTCDDISCQVEVFRIDVTWSAGCGPTCCPNGGDSYRADADINGAFKGSIFDLAAPHNTCHFNTPGGPFACTTTRVDVLTVNCVAGQNLKTRTVTHQCVCID